MNAQDDANFQVFGNKYREIINNQPVRKVLGRGAPPRQGAIWGVMIGWAYDHLGIFSWVPEMGSLNPFCDYDKNGRTTELERLRWNDEELGGRIFVDWKPYDHPQLGKVEIGGFVRKIYDPKFKAYINLMCYPGPEFEDFLVKHTQWNIYLVSMSPFVRIKDIEVTPLEAGYFKVVAKIQNQGFLPKQNCKDCESDNRFERSGAHHGERKSRPRSPSWSHSKIPISCSRCGVDAESVRQKSPHASYSSEI
jgi:hypothetical protein